MKNVDALMKVIDILIENEDKYPVYMKQYRCDFSTKEFQPFKDKHTCGTAGCILGWCPVLGEGDLVPVAEDFNRISVLDFGYYVERVFGIVDMGVIWDWLFDFDWYNSALAAKERLQFAIDCDFDIEILKSAEQESILDDYRISS